MWENESKLPTAWEVDEIYERWEKLDIDDETDCERFKNWRWIETDLRNIGPWSNRSI